MHTIRVAIYIRVSTQEQADEGHSIPMQTERLKKYCEAKGWTVVMIYSDPGFTGSNMSRPGLTKMISDIEAGLIDMVLVYKLDRLSRSQKDTLFLIEDVFLKHNVDFVSMSENFDTSTPFGRAMIGILSVFAQLEREQIKERMAMGHIGRAKEGYWHGGSGAPIGYDFVDGELKINEYEAMQIREIFSLFIDGKSLNSIAQIMKSKYTNKYSNWSHSAAIGKIVKNKLYIGKIKYKGKIYEGNHQPLITSEVFEAAQNRYSEIEKSKNGTQKTAFQGKHLLSGLMFCGNCGARYFTQCNMSKKFGTFYYYKCYTRDKNTLMKKAESCKNPIYREAVLNDYILNEIKKLISNPSIIDELYKKNNPPITNKSSTINHRLDEIEKQINKLMDLYQFGSVSAADIGKRIIPLQEEKEKLEKELTESSTKNISISPEQAKNMLPNIQDLIETNEIENQRKAINALITKITIYESDIKISWKFAI